MLDILPAEITRGATLRGNEYGWALQSLPDAVRSAEKLGYACLGGQFQFRLDDESTCEMYWLNADSTERSGDEGWSEYSRRSCEEVLTRFNHVRATTDWRREASEWAELKEKITAGWDPTEASVFVAYFVTESEMLSLKQR